jgi:hypothetical protein
MAVRGPTVVEFAPAIGEDALGEADKFVGEDGRIEVVFPSGDADKRGVDMAFGAPKLEPVFALPTRGGASMLEFLPLLPKEPTAEPIVEGGAWEDMAAARI